jgi:hypothetical protein
MPISSEITPNHSPYLSSANTGLGNALFQIASIYGIGRKYDIEVFYDNVVKLGNTLRKLFNYTHDTTIFRNVSKQGNCNYTPIQETMWRQYDSSFIDTLCKNKTTNYIIYGHLETPQYFKEYADDLRVIFSPDENSQAYLEAKYPFLFESESTVAVHIRSYKELDHPKSLPSSYYSKAIAHIEAHVTNPHYVVFTDTIYDRINFLEGKNYTIISNLYDYFDLWCMMYCKHFILSQSTFSYWGWILNANKDKHTVVPNWPSCNFYDNENVHVV